jgi:hypothetical protein
MQVGEGLGGRFRRGTGDIKGRVKGEGENGVLTLLFLEINNPEYLLITYKGRVRRPFSPSPSLWNWPQNARTEMPAGGAQASIL